MSPRTRRCSRAEGVEITLPTCDLPNLGARVLLFLDPNGVTLEFCEKLSRLVRAVSNIAQRN